MKDNDITENANYVTKIGEPVSRDGTITATGNWSQWKSLRLEWDMYTFHLFGRLIVSILWRSHQQIFSNIFDTGQYIHTWKLTGEQEWHNHPTWVVTLFIKSNPC